MKPRGFLFLLLFIASFLILSSCEKSITFVPVDAQPKVVIEASIENDQPPVIVLSRSLNYFSKISPSILAGSFIRNAQVDISNGTSTHRLREYAIPVGNGFTLYYYSIDSSNMSTAFEGEFNKSYSLQVNVNGDVFSAQTTIPPLSKKIDSVWWKTAPNNPDTSKTVLMVKATDPPGLGNYIRYFTKTNSDPFYPGFNSVFDDQIVDGTTYSLQVDRGVNRNEEIDFENFNFFNRGDTVTLKLCNIDKATFDFWRTMEFSYSSIGNPFSTPTKVISNIQGGGLGYFGGYACQYITLVIPE